MCEIKKHVVGELARKVYDDVLADAATSVGASLGKAVRTSLRPVDGLFWTVDQAFDWIAETVSRKFAHQGTTERDIHAAPVELTVRTLSALQTIGPLPDAMLRNMFANILAAGMTSSKRVHPSYVETLRQLVSDDCRLLSIVAWGPETPFSALGTPYDACSAPLRGVRYPLAQDFFDSETTLIYAADNLKRLGIIEEERHEIERPDRSPSKEVASIAHAYFDGLEVGKQPPARRGYFEK